MSNYSNPNLTTLAKVRHWFNLQDNLVHQYLDIPVDLKQSLQFKRIQTNKPKIIVKPLKKRLEELKASLLQPELTEDEWWEEKATKAHVYLATVSEDVKSKGAYLQALEQEKNNTRVQRVINSLPATFNEIKATFPLMQVD